MPSRPVAHGRLAGRPWAPVALAAGLLLTACASRCQTLRHDSSITLRIGFPIRSSHGLVGLDVMLATITNEGLIRTGRDGPEGRLAVRWETLDQGRTIRIQLRPGLKLSDGSPLAAEDVKASLELSRTSAAITAQYPTLAEITAIESESLDRLVIRLARPTSFILPDLEVPITKRRGERILGAGPYVLRRRSEDVTVLDANPHHYAGRPTIDTVEVLSYPTLRTAWTHMLTGEVDLLYWVPNEAREFVGNSGAAEVFGFLRPYVYTLVFNTTRPALRSPRVRAALARVVDRQAIVDRALGGQAIPAIGPLWPLHPAVTGQLPAPAYDPGAAKQLLSEAGLTLTAGYADHPPARLRFTTLLPAGVWPIEQIALVLQKQLFDVDVEMRVEPVAVDEFARRAGTGDYDAFLIDVIGGPSPVRPYRFWRARDASGAWGFGTSAVADALRAIGAAMDPATERDAVRRLQQVILQDPPGIFLCWPRTERAVSRRFLVPATDRDIFATLPQWRLNPSPRDAPRPAQPSP
jgi:ABC-type transport system substrate-binding protein